MTSDQIATNRALAIATVRTQMGLASRHPTTWTYEERTAYNKALAAYIQARPEQFSDSQLLAADLVSKQMYSALEDTSFDVSMFALETVKPAADALQSVGNGVLTTVNAAKWVIPVAAAVGLGLLFLFANKKLGGVVPGIK